MSLLQEALKKAESAVAAPLINTAAEFKAALEKENLLEKKNAVQVSSDQPNRRIFLGIILFVAVITLWRFFSKPQASIAPAPVPPAIYLTKVSEAKATEVAEPAAPVPAPAPVSTVFEPFPNYHKAPIASANPKEFSLTGITLADNTRLAVVNNKVFGVGDQVAKDIIVKEIKDNVVLLQSGHKIIKLEL